MNGFTMSRFDSHLSSIESTARVEEPSSQEPSCRRLFLRARFLFVSYLETDGWTRTSDPHNLKSGDIVVTPCTPDHLFVFDQWRNRRRLLARVIQSDGSRATRSLARRPNHNGSGFSFALREPASKRV